MTRQTSSVLMLLLAAALFVALLAAVLFLGLPVIHAGLALVGGVCGVAVLALHATRPR